MNGILKQYEERRSYPRIELKRNAVVTSQCGEKLSILMHDISKDGIQLRTSRENAAILHPSGKRITDENAPELTLTIALPCADKQHVFTARGKLKYLVRLEDDVFAIGIYFNKLSITSQEVIQSFIEYSMQPE